MGGEVSPKVCEELGFESAFVIGLEDLDLWLEEQLAFLIHAGVDEGAVACDDAGSGGDLLRVSLVLRNSTKMKREYSSTANMA